MTISWIEPVAYDYSKKELVNDIDLRVYTPDLLVFSNGYFFNKNRLYTIDVYNNVEIIRLNSLNFYELNISVHGRELITDQV